MLLVVVVVLLALVIVIVVCVLLSRPFRPFSVSRVAVLRFAVLALRLFCYVFGCSFRPFVLLDCRAQACRKGVLFCWIAGHRLAENGGGGFTGTGMSPVSSAPGRARRREAHKMAVSANLYDSPQNFHNECAEISKSWLAKLPNHLRPCQYGKGEIEKGGIIFLANFPKTLRAPQREARGQGLDNSSAYLLSFVYRCITINCCS